ncbi:N-acetylmuramyl-L-alanine amidase, negative regulator of AmpC, AmpD [Planktothrix serta PCC 8927]|uniref:N-acetylmuramoyl-L-alanine amidase n=1 Tax=Planktothrix serta PCC 8927 TaxID=671068 RepID=A0A7Z9BMR7_9CYAN|nr:peptidoglycan recognition family protein [Planktothrix serta]VXD12270.1 N-acetylmuramyl-L-alanine amidase, negative regulator of AmpC, AmpD [Planktothrix serta PCC 8927]
MRKWTPILLLTLYLLGVGVTVGLKNQDWIVAQGMSLWSQIPSPPEFERVIAETVFPSPSPSPNIKLVVAEEPQPKATQPQPETVANVNNVPVPGTCGLQPDPNPTARGTVGPPVNPVTLYRFRRPTDAQTANLQGGLGYTPNEYQALANPTNYGQRFLYDINRKPVNNAPIVVLHETVSDVYSAVNFFQAAQNSEDNQASYHTLIMLTGDIVYIVPPDLRAFGAGNSVFATSTGTETVKTHPQRPPSVNNFAYHVSLETPADGRNNADSHSGYTAAQYQSLAWLVAKTGVPDYRITTHAAVDRSGERRDPRSFDSQLFLQYLQSYPRTQEIMISCQSAYLN